LSRLDVLKQMFDAFINQILAYGFQTHIGLVTFGTKAVVSQKITNAVENFRHKLNDMHDGGDTALWDSKSTPVCYTLTTVLEPSDPFLISFTALILYNADFV
jgi:hypothetical protein